MLFRMYIFFYCSKNKIIVDLNYDNLYSNLIVNCEFHCINVNYTKTSFFRYTYKGAIPCRELTWGGLTIASLDASIADANNHGFSGRDAYTLGSYTNALAGCSVDQALANENINCLKISTATLPRTPSSSLVFRTFCWEDVQVLMRDSFDLCS